MSPARLPAWFALPLLIVASLSTTARAQSVPVKPYVLFILDTSGSMDNNIANSAPASCIGAGRSKIDNAKCAIQDIANNEGDMVMGLSRFRQSRVDDSCANGCVVQAAGACAANGDALEVIVPIVDDNQAQLASWTSFSCSGCSATATDPELYAPGQANTPLEGSLDGAKLYWQGASSPSYGAYWTGPGDDPIRDDPLNNVFTSPGNQCRPYITILMTDGDETCSGTPKNGATSLLTTNVDGSDYRIVTDVIGFGQNAPYQPLEDIAHAGGSSDVGLCGTNNATACTSNANCAAGQSCNLAAGVCSANTATQCTSNAQCTVAGQTCNLTAITEAHYAQNQEQLELAVNQIIAGAIKFELCNGVDDDCDGNIDEGFDVDATCHDNGVGACQGTGVKVCTADGRGTVCSITQPGAQPGTEVCNGIDDDCDGLVDEGNVCQGCTGGVELCDGMDNDCDGAIDEDLTRPCGTDVGDCVAGTEVCQAGQWVGCTAIGPSPEVCDGHDNDCDGTTDGEVQDCYTGPNGTEGVGICHGGTQVCSNGTFGTCSFEQDPVPEVCDTLDNDCDGTVDEDTGGATCSSSCGLGQTECQNGTIVCNSQPVTGPDLCDGIDSDCDGHIDENAPPGGPCTTAQVCDGQLVCQSGQYVCVGTAPHPELCNCEDDDCDNQVDEEVNCGSGSTCVHPQQAGYACQCAQACQPGEFPCPQGRTCVDGFCLVDPCSGVTCGPLPNGDATTCVLGNCVDACSQISCPTGTICYGPDGQCHPDNCVTFPDRCTADQFCVDGSCVDNACLNVTCPADQYCVGGTCAGSCAGVDCPAGQSCQLGTCTADPCGQLCPDGTFCDGMHCVASECDHTHCPVGESCDPSTGGCVQDPCLGVTCPEPGQVCRDGSCYDPSQLAPPAPDAGEQELVTAAGGGCNAGGGSGGVLVLLALAGMIIRRGSSAALRSDERRKR